MKEPVFSVVLFHGLFHSCVAQKSAGFTDNCCF